MQRVVGKCAKHGYTACWLKITKKQVRKVCIECDRVASLARYHRRQKAAKESG